MQLSQLHAMGRFILFMQRPDGSFHSWFREDTVFDADRDSLFFPGQAVLALVRLYNQDLDPQWLQAASRAVAHIVRTRETMPQPPPDMWLLRGARELVQLYDQIPEPAVHRAAIIVHMEAVARVMLAAQDQMKGRGVFDGSFAPGGESMATSMAILSLLALDDVVKDSPGHAPLRALLQQGILAGMRFLIRCQVSDGEGHGGFVRAVTKIPDAAPAFNDAQAEIRIDYMHLAIEAMLGVYRDVCPTTDACQ